MALCVSAPGCNSGGGLNVNLTAHLAWKIMYVGYLYISFARDVQHNFMINTSLSINW
ncbi:MAG TPA: hypothetical protein VI699_03540 [Candidatus Acidoferrales bacterium]|nr:hypothetical protein [Candidatus Acidoferrales bacterium]